MDLRAVALVVASCASLFRASFAMAQRHMENLGRGIVAINKGGGEVFVSWRLLGTDPENIRFNVYREVAGEVPLKLNGEPLVKATWFTDRDAKLEKATSYFVRPLLNGKESGPSGHFTFEAHAP